MSTALLNLQAPSDWSIGRREDERTPGRASRLTGLDSSLNCRRTGPGDLQQGRRHSSPRRRRWFITFLDSDENRKANMLMQIQNRVCLLMNKKKLENHVKRSYKRGNERCRFMAFAFLGSTKYLPSGEENQELGCEDPACQATMGITVARLLHLCAGLPVAGSRRRACLPVAGARLS